MLGQEHGIAIQIPLASKNAEGVYSNDAAIGEYKIYGKKVAISLKKYNSGIVDAIKSVPERSYYSKTKFWAIPISSIPELVNQFSKLRIDLRADQQILNEIQYGKREVTSHSDKPKFGTGYIFDISQTEGQAIESVSKVLYLYN